MRCRSRLFLLSGLEKSKRSQALAESTERGATGGLEGVPCLSHWNRPLSGPPLWNSAWRGAECSGVGWWGCRRHSRPLLSRRQLRGWRRGWGSRSASVPSWLSFSGPRCWPGVYQRWEQHEEKVPAWVSSRAPANRLPRILQPVSSRGKSWSRPCKIQTSTTQNLHIYKHTLCKQQGGGGLLTSRAFVALDGFKAGVGPSLGTVTACSLESASNLVDKRDTDLNMSLLNPSILIYGDIFLHCSLGNCSSFSRLRHAADSQLDQCFRCWLIYKFWLDVLGHCSAERWTSTPLSSFLSVCFIAILSLSTMVFF